MNQNLKLFVKQTKLFQYYRYVRPLASNSSDRETVYYKRQTHKQYKNMLSTIDIKIEDKRFQHWIDTNINFVNIGVLIGNMPPNYSLVLQNSIQELKSNKIDNYITCQNNKILQCIEKYIEMIIDKIEMSDIKNKERSINYYKRMINHKSESLEESLQRILFWSSLFWQSGHKLVGLGRLDVILAPFINELTDEKITAILKDFLSELHNYYEFKSASLLGDIGQIIILGGLNANGDYFSNRLTYCFMDAIKELKYPDPKILLRVCDKTPRELLEKAADSIATGVGSPLLSNDDIIIPALIDFGYEQVDAYNYVTSACWEPLIYGKSLEQNNLTNINFAKVFVDTLKDTKLNDITSFDNLIELYKEHLKTHVKEIFDKVNSINWNHDPLYTLFTEGCIQKSKDISCGGAVYNNYGFLSVGLSNTIDSILNIKLKVFDNKEIKLADINYTWNDVKKKQLMLLDSLDLSNDYFGHDDLFTIELTNNIIDFTRKEIATYRNALGGKIKFGLSSPSYIDEGTSTGTTFDGRKNDSALGVHISANNAVGFTELISFASQLHYKGFSSNGNVVDFFISPDFIKNNFSKFVDFMFLSIKQGFFQLQINVVSSSTLIEAKKHPEQYRDLIVRVWGFSSYFNDLPDDYKDILIKRSLLSENNVNTV